MMSIILMIAKTVPLVFAALFPVINPIGTAIILLGMTGALDKDTRRKVSTKIAVNTFVLLSIVLLAGTYLLSFFGITIPIVQAAGGLVLASMGWTMLNHQDDSRNEELNAAAGASSKSHIWDQIFYPYTFPVTVGPGCIAVTLTLSAHSQHDAMSLTIAHQIGVALGIAANCLVVYFSLVYSDLIALRLGPSGTKVLLRLMAFVLICLGAEIFWTGAEFLLKQAFRS